ncbi:MAG TPA: hypothetical protein VFR86_02745 [Burkholderiaceae bacterium]|nr:hypothetical protein [Burkholderiaceae bacterium]
MVGENNVQVQVGALRRLLSPQAMATIPGRGYRFSAAFDDEQPALCGKCGRPATHACTRG